MIMTSLDDTLAPVGGPAGPSGARAPMSREEFTAHCGAILRNLTSVIDGKDDEVSMALTVFLAGGHLLMEDVPGTGKTVLAKSLAASVGGSVARIQFTPDLLPSDVTGVSVYNQATRDFEFKPGPVFANILIGDEINRASPKTQSALLECMEERQVSVDGITHLLPRPFAVVATQNPVEMEGTYSLPEAQRDRFMARLSLGYPDERAELEMIRTRDAASPLDALRPVVTRDELERMIDYVQSVYVAPPVQEYVVAIMQATRIDPELRLGGSPRATLQLIAAAKSLAAINDRDFVVPDDIDALAVPVLGHRLLPATRLPGRSGSGASHSVTEIVQRILASTPVPFSGRGD
ncbi:ATPase [Rathayibacter caricis DSM 15933]|uniref:ATPase n=2 Tax=Rathayibacter caricis TaxID=110936 RepID=A0A2T4UVM5_9MICO|nr:ATPase [Rathayibacter caricis DSM 15933]